MSKNITEFITSYVVPLDTDPADMEKRAVSNWYDNIFVQNYRSSGAPSTEYRPAEDGALFSGHWTVRGEATRRGPIERVKHRRT